MRNIEKFLVREECTIRDALQTMDRTGDGILLLIDSNKRLIRTITDGDLRRLLLAGHDVTGSLSLLPQQQPITVHHMLSASEALDLMTQYQVDHLPVVDDKGIPCDLYIRRDLDQRILLSTPHLGENEMEFVEEAFRTNWIAPVGPNVDAFERELADHVGIQHAVAVSSGTAALHLALRVLGVGHGDTVFCSTLTFVASANPILYQGARPVFIDSEPGSWNMSPAALERALSDADAVGKLPKAVIIVNLYGQSADMDALDALCARYGIPTIEDAAESLGATYKDRSSGTLGRIGVYSFNGNKIITTSGGGMLVSNEGKLIEKARALSTQARDPAPWYEHTEVGYNYRMSNVLAGIGRGQLRVLEQRVQARRAIFDRYRDGLAAAHALRWMPEANYGRSTRWLSVCLIDRNRSEIAPTAVIDRLANSGIEARYVWKPMHRQPLFRGCSYYPHADNLSFSDVAFGSGICLPSGSNMTVKQQERIVQIIGEVFCETAT